MTFYFSSDKFMYVQQCNELPAQMVHLYRSYLGNLGNSINATMYQASCDT